MTARRLIVICGRVGSVPSIAVIAAFAWADGCSWFKVIPLLEARGLHVVAVQNPLIAGRRRDDERAIARFEGRGIARRALVRRGRHHSGGRRSKGVSDDFAQDLSATARAVIDTISSHSSNRKGELQ